MARSLRYDVQSHSTPRDPRRDRAAIRAAKVGTEDGPDRPVFSRTFARTFPAPATVNRPPRV